MRRPTSPFTEILLQTYLGLLAVSIVLSGVLINRHIAIMQRSREVLAETITAPPTTPLPRVGPTINWGGQKR